MIAKVKFLYFDYIRLTMTEMKMNISERENAHTGERSIEAKTIPIAKDSHGLLFTVRIDFRRSDITLGAMVKAMQEVEHAILKAIMEHRGEYSEE